jgi:CheY-like chemotaxis protein
MVIPVIVMSSSKAKLDLQANYKAYANGFVTKPFIPSEHHHVIKTIEKYWFQLNETARALSEKCDALLATPNFVSD